MAPSLILTSSQVSAAHLHNPDPQATWFWTGYIQWAYTNYTGAWDTNEKSATIPYPKSKGREDTEFLVYVTRHPDGLNLDLLPIPVIYQ